MKVNSLPCLSHDRCLAFISSANIYEQSLYCVPGTDGRENPCTGRLQILTADIGKQVQPSNCTMTEGCMSRPGALKQDHPNQTQKFQAFPKKQYLICASETVCTLTR